MKKLPLDMSKFKKIKSDAKSSTLQHQDGHTLTIAHQALSPAMLNSLNKLPSLQENPVDEKSPMEDAHHGIMYAEGDMVEPNPQPNTASDDSEQSSDQASNNSQAQNNETERTPAFNGDYGLESAQRQNMQGLEQESQGAQQAAIAKGAAAQSQAPVEQQGAQNLTNFANKFESERQKLLANSDVLQNELSTGKVNPRQFIENMSTGSKVLNGIGLVIGGMGAGLTHSPNLAFQYLQSQIDRDIDSQKANIGVKKSLLDYNLQEQQNLPHAIAATTAQYQDIISHELNQQADLQGNTIGAANAKMVAGQMQQKKAEILQNLAVQKAMLGAPGSAEGNKIQFLHAMGKDAFANQLEQKYVPQSGQAPVNVPPEARQSIEQFNALDSVYQNAQDYLDHTNALGAGWQNAHKAEGQSIMKNMALTMGELQNLNRYTPAEAEQYQKQTPDLTGTHLTDQDQAKLDTLKNILVTKKNALAQTYGLPQTNVRYKHGKPYAPDPKTPGQWKRVK